MILLLRGRGAGLVRFFGLCFSIVVCHVVAHPVKMHPVTTLIASCLENRMSAGVVKHVVDVVVVVV